MNRKKELSKERKATQDLMSSERIGTTDTGSFIDFMDFDYKIVYLTEMVNRIDTMIFNNNIDIKKNKKKHQTFKNARLETINAKLDINKLKYLGFIDSVKKEQKGHE